MNSLRRIGIVGVTGLVGQELLKVLEKRNYPVDEIRGFASQKSLGTSFQFRGKSYKIGENNFDNLDLIFLCAGSEYSRKFRDEHKDKIVIDLSSAFREDPQIPLIIPEINGGSIDSTSRWIASPNCVATLMLMALYPLHRLYTLKSIIGSTYQSASGGGRKMLQRLFGKEESSIPYNLNLFSHDSSVLPNGFNAEENKISSEIQKILQMPELAVCMTCIRVPVLRAHSISLHISFEKEVCVKESKQAVANFKGVELFEFEDRFATPYDATEKDTVFVSRVRRDLHSNRSLLLWVVGDQLLKGAALNAVQIAELLRSIHGIHSTSRC